MNVTDDIIPEFDEYYQIELINVVGGGRLADKNLKVKVVINENDAPYGLFSIEPSYLKYEEQLKLIVLKNYKNWKNNVLLFKFIIT